MTTPVSNIPVSVDYTSRDFYSLRSALIERVQARLEAVDASSRWRGDDPSDFGVALIEAFAYMGDMLSYYIDRAANESFISTATQRQTVLNIARSYGYTPAGFQAALTELTIENISDETVVIPSGTQFSGEILVLDSQIEIIFTTVSETVIEAGETAQTVLASHGERVSLRPEYLVEGGEIIGISDGIPNQRFELAETTVVENSVRVYIEVGDDWIEWTPVSHISDFSSTDTVFELLIDANNVHSILFGDGVSGAIPAANVRIKADYVVGGGVQGNIAGGVLSSVKAVPGFTEAQVAALASSITVTNEVATGGNDPESTESVRLLAPRALTALNRAVSIEDYQNLVLGVSGVGKAKAVASSRTSVTIYMSPLSSDNATDIYPGLTPEDPEEVTSELIPKAEWLALQERVEEFLQDRIQLGVSVTVSPPTYVPVTTVLEYTKLSGYSTEQVESQIKTQLLSIFSYNNINFGAVIRPEEVEFQLRQLPLVDSIKVVSLYRTSDSLGRNVLIAEPDEIFVFSEASGSLDSVELSEASNNSLADEISLSVGTLSPAFNSAISNYVVSVPNGTTSTVVTVTPEDTGSSVYVNGSTGAVKTITIPVGTTVVSVVVFAANAVTSSSYTLTITRVS
jgi:hypothetical protein